MSVNAMSFDGSSRGPQDVGSSTARPDSPTLPPFSIHDAEHLLFDIDEVPEEYEDHTTINSAEEPQVEESLQEAIDATLQSPTLSEPETVLLVRSQSRSSTPSTEPFPELNASEVHVPSDEYKAQERAYDYALSKVAEEDQRNREINDCIAALRGPLVSVEEGNAYLTLLEGVHPCPEVTHYDHFCVHHETHKQTLFSRVSDFLNLDEELPDSFRRRFLIVCSLIADIEVIFFRGKGFPNDPVRLVSIDELDTTLEYAARVYKYVFDVNFLISNEKKNAERIRYHVAQVAAERGLSLVGRFQHMSRLITHYLKRIRYAEQSFFELFLQFYDVFLYEDFHVMYNNFRVEQSMDGVPRRLQQTSHSLTVIYQLLANMAQEYKDLGQINADIGGTYISPVVQELSQGPCICNEIFDCISSAPDSQDEPAHHLHCPQNKTEEAESELSLGSSGDGSASGPQTNFTRHVFEQWLFCKVRSEPCSETRQIGNIQLSTTPPDKHHAEPDQVGLMGQSVEDHGLHSHDAKHGQEMPSQPSQKIAAQTSSLEDEPAEHYQSSSFQETDTEYTPAEVMFNSEFVDYYSVNQANHDGQDDLSHAFIESYTVGYSPYGVPLPNGLPTMEQIEQLEGEIFRRLRVPNTLDHGSHTLAESQEENFAEYACTPEQSLNNKFDSLGLNSSDDEWLPYDHDADTPEEHDTTFGHSAEQMVSTSIYENNNYSQPRLPGDFHFRDVNPAPSSNIDYNVDIRSDFTTPNFFNNYVHYRYNLETGPILDDTGAHGPLFSSGVTHGGFPQYEGGMRKGSICRNDGTHSPLFPPNTETIPELRYIPRRARYHVSRLGRRGARYA